MQIYFHSRLWSYLPRVPILVEGTVYGKRYLSKNTTVHIWNAVKTSGCIYVSWRQDSVVVCSVVCCV